MTTPDRKKQQDMTTPSDAVALTPVSYVYSRTNKVCTITCVAVEEVPPPAFPNQAGAYPQRQRTVTFDVPVKSALQELPTYMLIITDPVTGINTWYTTTWTGTAWGTPVPVTVDAATTTK